MVLSTLLRETTLGDPLIPPMRLFGLSLRVTWPPPLKVVKVLRNSFETSPPLFRSIAPLFLSVPPTANVVLSPMRIVPRLAPEPVPAPAVNTPPVIDRVAALAVWMLPTVSLVEAVTV